MNRKLATFISVLMHPIWMPTVLFGVIFLFAPQLAMPLSEKGMWMLLLAIFISTIIFPFLSLSTLRLTRNISSFKMEDSKERFIPFLFTGLFYGLTTYLLGGKMQVNIMLVLIMAGITALTLMISVISRKYKISAHSSGAAGMLGFLVAMAFLFKLPSLFYPLLVYTILAGISMSARLALGDHNLSQVCFGALLGFVVCFSTLFFIL
ncbi:PA-phosphatase [Xanthovirga aplysinae]|uniref:PA-phosphatase n=1 Tax=Xanthovirga aplysinae TaxID=2529853 RepID=UPI0012BD6A21|nr:PA-phosphatase [Xanthovirga aplysinae]MTI30806.1 PA-phosphatase [Xanthovirga aplysinae]